MLTRKITQINNRKLQKCKILEMDPHGYFLCLYCSYPQILQIIKVSELKQHLLKDANSFALEGNFEIEQNLQVMFEFTKGRLFQNEMQAEGITIGHRFKNQQIIAVHSSITIKVFKLDWNKLTDNARTHPQKLPQLTVYWEICQSLNTPIVKTSVFYNVLYISYYDKHLKVMEVLDESERKWRDSNEIILHKDEFIRIKVSEGHKENLKKTLQSDYKSLHDHDNDKQKQKKQQKSPQYGQKDSKIQTNQLILKKRMLYSERDQAQIPEMIYQTADNCLFFNQELISKEFQRPVMFADLSEEEKYLEKNQEKLERYCLSSNQNYILGIEDKQTYHIRSKKAHWGTILKESTRPQVCPFLDTIVEQFCFNFFKRHGSQKYRKICKYLKGVDLVLTANSRQTLFSEQSHQESMKVELKHKPIQNIEQEFQNQDWQQSHSVEIELSTVFLQKNAKKKYESSEKDFEETQRIWLRSSGPKIKIVNKKHLESNAEKKYQENSGKYKNQKSSLIMVSDLPSPVHLIRWMDDSSLICLGINGEILSLMFLDGQLKKKVWRVIERLLESEGVL